MTERSFPDLVRPAREATDRALAALDVMMRHFKVRLDGPEAMVLEAQREIILSLGLLSELVAEVGESQSDILATRQNKAAIRQGVQSGLTEGLKEVAGEVRRKRSAARISGGVPLRVPSTTPSSRPRSRRVRRSPGRSRAPTSRRP